MKGTWNLMGLLATFLFACSTNDQSPISDQSKNKLGFTIHIDIKQASRLASLPMKCLLQEYPNKLGQVLGSSSELKSPKQLHPVFYGCFDWHSSVHGHWLLVSLLNHFPDLPEKEQITQLLDQQFQPEKILQEKAFFQTALNSSFERTYGWAWLLMLQNELNQSKHPHAPTWRAALQALSVHLIQSFKTYLPKLLYPIRTGEHTNTAFGLSLALNYALATNDKAFIDLIRTKSLAYFGRDRAYNFDFEPGGNDFISPGLQEIDLMRKLLPKKRFMDWLKVFCPGIFDQDFELVPGKVSDRSDGKLVHLDGLNFNRAWCLYGLANDFEQLAHLRVIADQHLNYSLPAITDGDYMGEHWLASFAWYAILRGNRQGR